MILLKHHDPPRKERTLCVGEVYGKDIFGPVEQRNRKYAWAKDFKESNSNILYCFVLIPELVTNSWLEKLRNVSCR